MHEVSSLMIVPKWRVFKPVDEVSVLPGPLACLAHVTKRFWVCSLSVHRVADPDDRMQGSLDGIDVCRQMRGDLQSRMSEDQQECIRKDLVNSIASDQRHPSISTIGIHN
jgi:hypothetical protein